MNCVFRGLQVQCVSRLVIMSPQCPCTSKWHNFKQNTAKKRREEKHLKAGQTLKATGVGGSPVCRVWTSRSRRRSSHRWLLRVEGLIQESNPWMFDVGPNICVYDSQTDIFREGERMEITLSYEEQNKLTMDVPSWRITGTQCSIKDVCLSGHLTLDPTLMTHTRSLLRIINCGQALRFL